MKLSTIKGSRKRKQETSLLKIANIKKAKVEQKMTTIYNIMQKTYKIRTHFPESVLYPAKQQFKHISQQVKSLDVNAIQNSINHCGCVICQSKSMETLQRSQQWQVQRKIQVANRSLVYKKQQKIDYGQKQQITTLLARKTKPVLSHYNPDSMEARLVNFKPSTSEENLSAVCDDIFYRQKVNFYLKHIPKQHVNAK